MPEEIELGKYGRLILIFLIGLAVGFSIKTFVQANQVTRSPSELADYVEEIAFDKKHRELMHVQLQALIDLDSTTIADFKRYYDRTKQSGSRMMLESYLNEVCYKKQWR